jgi:hypothetical protein
MVYNSIEFRGTVIALLGKLSRRVSFNDPAFKPYLFSGLFALLTPPTKRTITRITPPPLLSIAVQTILFDSAFAAMGALFFS